MYTKAQITERIEHLKSISPNGARSLFSELESAISGYFTRDGEFESLVRKTLMRVVSDAYSRGLIVEYPERLPELSNYFPLGYSNIAEIFGGEVFGEIMTVADNTFVAAFVSETQGSNGQSVTWKNPLITEWISGISASKGSEAVALEVLGEFCIACNEERGLALIFEELGQINQHWSNRQRELARHCYIERGFDWLITNFSLNVFEPHYINEIRN